jgi:hypothetical protein
MSFKRYIFKSGLDIIAPLKCGTRWLNEFDIEERIDMLQFASYDEELAQNIHSDITFIWRPVREHFISAIKTEWNASPNKDIWDIITEMEFGRCYHWYPYMYKKLYPLWLKFGFKFHKLRALSQLTPSASEYKWTSNLYKMLLPLPIEHITVGEVLKYLSPEQSIKIQNLISEEENWLKLMIEAQYSGYNGEEYSNLEDSMLETKCKVTDLEDKLINLEDEIIKLKSELAKYRWIQDRIQDKRISTLESNMKFIENNMRFIESNMRFIENNMRFTIKKSLI